MQDINALIDLLDDPDETVFSHIEEVLTGLGPGILPHLDAANEHAANALHKERISRLFRKLQSNDAADQLRKWVSNEHRNLLRGAHLVSLAAGQRGEYAELEQAVEQVRKDAWLELNHNLTALEKIRILNYILFEVHGFKFTQPPFHSIEEHCIHQCMATRQGSPVIISLLYTALANLLEMPVYIMRLPGQFVLAYLDDPANMPVSEQQGNVLFYINVFNKGSVFSSHEISKYLRKMNVRPEPSHFFPGSNIMAVHQLLKSIEFSFETSGHQFEADAIRLTRVNLLSPAVS
ncbi:MAG: hypothetical protein KDD36_03780 [Flavobacteriales bacterium]|nr:hypothetical protein [Flavobacteriales bacterium]